MSNDKEYFEKDVPLWVKFTKAYRLCRIESTSLWNRPYPPRNIDTNHYPYPNFDKKYSPFWEEGAKYIQEDWRLAGLAYLETCKKFFLTANLKEIDWYKDAAGYDVKALEFIEETKALLESYKR